MTLLKYCFQYWADGLRIDIFYLSFSWTNCMNWFQKIWYPSSKLVYQTMSHLLCKEMIFSQKTTSISQVGEVEMNIGDLERLVEWGKGRHAKLKLLSSPANFSAKLRLSTSMWAWDWRFMGYIEILSNALLAVSAETEPQRLPWTAILERLHLLCSKQPKNIYWYIIIALLYGTY